MQQGNSGILTNKNISCLLVSKRRINIKILFRYSRGGDIEMKSFFWQRNGRNLKLQSLKHCPLCRSKIHQAFAKVPQRPPRLEKFHPCLLLEGHVKQIKFKVGCHAISRVIRLLLKQFLKFDSLVFTIS